MSIEITQDTRNCLRCRRILGTIGRMVDGEPVCPSCARWLNEPKACPRCARMAKIFGRDRDTGERVCQNCLNRHTHATCAACGKYRKAFGRDTTGRPLCNPCVREPGLSHACPDCGVDVAGGGSARCPHCASARSVGAAVERQFGLIRTEWARSLFRAACAREALTAAPPVATRVVARLARDIRELEADFPAGVEIDQAGLMQRYGAEGLRRKLRLLRTLSAETGFVWSAEDAMRTSEQRRVDAILSEAEPLGHRDLLETYLGQLDPGLAERTRRSYARAALSFLESLAGRAPETADDARMAVFLRANPGQRAAVGPFVRFLRERLGAPIAMPKQRARPTQRTLDRRLLRRAAALHGALRDGGRQAERRAWLAALLAALSGASLEDVLALRGTAFRALRDGRLHLTTPRGGLTLPPDVGAFCRELAAVGDEGPAFAGRYGDRPLHPVSVSYHVAKLGLPSTRRGRRPTAPSAPYALTLPPRTDA